MKTRSGSMLLSVISLLVIGGAFESQRYANFLERQQLYRLIIQSFEHPETTVDGVTTNVQKSTKSHDHDDLKRHQAGNRTPVSNEKRLKF